MKLDAIRGMNNDELRGAELNVRQSLFETRMAKSTGELTDIMLSRRLRKDLARILTVTRERSAEAPASSKEQ
jgi:ribosomal protein L29